MRLLATLERLDLADVLSIRVEPRWPKAIATLERRFAAGTVDLYDVTPEGTMTPRPPGPRAVEREPEIKGHFRSAPEPMVIEVEGGDLWGQCLEVVRAGILGTTEAAEHRVGERLFYVLVGRGRPRSPERLAFLRA